MESSDSAVDSLFYDPANPAVNANPFPVFRTLRERDPVHFSKPVGGWVVTRFADVQSGLKDARLSSDRITPAMVSLSPAEQEAMRELWSSLTHWSVFADPPRHTRLRGLFNRAFTPKAIARLATRIQAIVDELLTEPLARGEIEFIDEFAYPFPALVICEMLGIPPADIHDIQRWSDDVATFIGLPRKPWDSYVAAHRSNHAMIEYFRALIEEHRRTPRENLLSNLISATENGQSLTEEELISTCILLLFAAHTTTTHLLGNGLVALLRHPAELALLRADATLFEPAVEELLRFDGPIQAVRRSALESLEIGGRSIAAGELVFFMINAANRDPERFLRPDELDIRRNDGRHLGFGAAIHFCPGAGLARMEAHAAFRTLLTRTESLELATSEFEWLKSFGFRGIRKLPMRLVRR